MFLNRMVNPSIRLCSWYPLLSGYAIFFRIKTVAVYRPDIFDIRNCTSPSKGALSRSRTFYVYKTNYRRTVRPSADTNRWVSLELSFPLSLLSFFSPSRFSNSFCIFLSHSPFHSPSYWTDFQLSLKKLLGLAVSFCDTWRIDRACSGRLVILN